MQTSTPFQFTYMIPGMSDRDFKDSETLTGIPKGFIERNINLLNSAGVLMNGNCHLYISGAGKRATYQIEHGDTSYYSLTTGIPMQSLDSRTGDPVDIREELQLTLDELKSWIGGNKVSKRMLGKAVIMKKEYPQLDREAFISVLKNDLSIESFKNILKLGNGEYNEGLVSVVQLPDIFLSKIME